MNGKPRPIPVMYLGSADDLLAKLTSLEEGGGRMTVRSFRHGDVAALKAMADRLGVAELIDRHVSGQKQGLSVGTTLLLGALNRAVRPRSKRGWADWAKQTSIPHLFGLDKPDLLTSQFFWDQMNKVDQKALESIEAELCKKVIAEFQLRLDTLLYDTTNFFTYIASDNPKPKLAQRGHNKQRRIDLRQISLALFCTRDSRIPLCTQVYEGNSADSSQFPDSLTRIRQRMEAIAGAGLEDLTLVYDRGNNSKENQALVDQSPFHYVGALTPAQHADIASIPLKDYGPLESGSLAGTLVHRCQKEIWGAVRTLVLYKSEQLKAGQSRGLDQHLAKRIKKLEEWKASLAKPGSGPRTPASGRKQAEALCRGQYVEDVLQATYHPRRRGENRVNWNINAQARERLEREVFGKRLLMTSRHEWSTEDIILAYRGQGDAEAIFRQVKDPFHLAVRPQFHWTDQKIRVHVFICLLAYMLARLVEREATQKAGWTGTLSHLLEDLGKVRLAMVVTQPPKSKRKGRSKCSWVLEGGCVETQLLAQLVPQQAPFVYTEAVG